MFVVAILISGGPPVSRTREGSWALWGAMRSLTESSERISGVLIPEDTLAFRSVICESCLLRSVRGIPST